MNATEYATKNAGFRAGPRKIGLHCRDGVRSRIAFLVVLPLLLTAVLLAGRADGVERYEAVRLLDAGFGAEPLSVSQSITRPISGVAGRIELADGRSVPVVWEVESDGSSTVSRLPIPTGASGTAFDVQTLDELLVIVGTVTPTEGPSQAVLWIGTVAEGFTALPLTDLGNGSRANGLVPSIGAGRGEVVGEMTLDSGRIVPVVWSIDFDTSEITRQELPLPPDAEGTANSITRVANGDLVAVGTLSRDGRMRAAQWYHSHKHGVWSVELLDTPRRADSVAGFVCAFDFFALATVGSVCFDGLCEATMWGPGGRPLGFGSWHPSFIDSSAFGLFGDGGALAVVGRMTDAEGDVGALFLPQVELAADINKLLFNFEIVLVTSVTAIGPGGIMVGTGVKDGTPPVNCGIILLPVGSYVPQQVGVPVGKVTAGDPASTWRDDNDRLRLKPGGARGGRTIVAQFESQAVGSVEPAGPFVNLLCNGRAKNESATFDVRVQVFNFQTNQWETAGQIQATTTEACYSVEVPAAPASYFDNQKRLRVRLQIRRTSGNGRWEFEVNSLSSMSEGESCGI